MYSLNAGPGITCRVGPKDCSRSLPAPAAYEEKPSIAWSGSEQATERLPILPGAIVPLVQECIVCSPRGGFRTWVTLLWFEVTGLGWFFQCRGDGRGALRVTRFSSSSLFVSLFFGLDSRMTRIVDLARLISRMEPCDRRHLSWKSHVTSQTEVVKQQIEVEILTTHIEVVLATDKGKTLAQFKKQRSEMLK